MNTYIHKTAQRLRVRSDFIRQNPQQVADLIKQLTQIDAITDVKHKRYAGSVALCFNGTELDCEELLELLDSHGWTRAATRASFIENAVVNGTKTFAKGMTMMALKQLVGPTLSRAIISL
ncbi:MAG: hypothetical protein V5788_04645 [Shewanella sp.]